MTDYNKRADEMCAALEVHFSFPFPLLHDTTCALRGNMWRRGSVAHQESHAADSLRAIPGRGR
jgi:hypothetical protein